MWIVDSVLESRLAGYQLKEGFEDIWNTPTMDARYYMPSGSMLAPRWRWVGSPSFHTRDGDYLEYYRIVNNFEKGN